MFIQAKPDSGLRLVYGCVAVQRHLLPSSRRINIPARPLVPTFCRAHLTQQKGFPMIAMRLSTLLLFTSLALTAQAPYTLHAVVTGSKNTPAPNLPATAFTLQDNGQPTPILSVRAGDPQPAKLLIVIDAVNASYTQVAYQRSQLERFLTANGGTLAYPASIVIAADTTLQATPGFTTNGTTLNASLQQQTVALRDIRRSAGFYGAEERLDISLQALRKILIFAGSTPGHKLILFISPGWPLLSGPGVQLSGKDESRIYTQVESLSQAIHASNSTLYSINPLGAGEDLVREDSYEAFLKGATKPSQAQIGNLGLQVLAIQSGGLSLNGNNDISKLLMQCVADATAPYTLTFNPALAEPGSDYHRLDLHVADPGLKARTTTGLYITTPR